MKNIYNIYIYICMYILHHFETKFSGPADSLTQFEVKLFFLLLLVSRLARVVVVELPWRCSRSQTACCVFLYWEICFSLKMKPSLLPRDAFPRFEMIKRKGKGAV